MKVKTWVEFQKEVEVEVSFADVFGAMDALDVGDRMPFVLHGIHCAYGVLTRIKDERISEMTPEQRLLVAMRLVEQADRFGLQQVWRPIEGAPRDGTHFVAIEVSDGAGFGWPVPGGPKVHAQTVVHWHEGAFWPSVSFDGEKAQAFNATHWMPLRPFP